MNILKASKAALACGGRIRLDCWCPDEWINIETIEDEKGNNYIISSYDLNSDNWEVASATPPAEGEGRKPILG